MAAPTVYYWDDPGAPAWDSGVDGLYKVLKGCLVDGYGNKAAAGWATVFDTWSTDKSAQFTNAAGSGLIGLKHTITAGVGAHNYSPVIYVADAMQSASIAVNGRSNGKQITDVSSLVVNYSLKRSGYHGFGEYTYNFPQAWTLIANNNSAVLIYQHRDSQGHAVYGYQGNAAYTTSRISFLYFGAVSSDLGLGGMSSPLLGNFLCFGGTFDLSSNNSSFTSPASGLVASINRNASGIASDNVARVLPYEKYFSRPFRNVSSVSLLRAHVSVGSDHNYYNQDMIGSVPIFAAMGVYAFQNQAEVDKYSIAGANLKSPVTVSGVQYLYALVNTNTPIYISLDAADWS